MRKFLGVAVLGLALAGCQQGISSWSQTYGPTFPAPKDGMAAVYLVRGAAPADAPPIPVSAGRQAIGNLYGSSWMRLDVAPNPVDLRAYGTQDSSELIITVAAGETRFLIVEPLGATNAKFMTVSWDEGRRLVRDGLQAPVTYYAASSN